MNYPLSIMTAIISAIILVAFLPNFISTAYTTETVENENAGWIRFNYSTNLSASIDYEIEDGVLSVGGSAPQEGPIGDMIIWADTNLSVFINEGVPQYIGSYQGSVTSGSLSDTFTVTKGANDTKITDGADTYTFDKSNWAFIPNAGGNCASYLDGNETHMNETNFNRAYVGGGVAGVFAFNQYNTSGYNLVMVVDKDNHVIRGADWEYTDEVVQ